jgi:predicted NAD/FAD-binding protein
MAAAAELASRDIPVTVFETARTLGGRARRVEINGVALDNGLHILIGAYRETLRLIELTRRPQETPGLVRLPLELIVHPHFRLRAPRLPAPLHLAAALICARGLGLTERMKAAAFIAAVRRENFRLEADNSVERLLAFHRQPAAVTRFLWNPLCISALNTQPHEASAQIFLNVLRDSLNGRARGQRPAAPDNGFLRTVSRTRGGFSEPARRRRAVGRDSRGCAQNRRRIRPCGATRAFQPRDSGRVAAPP